MSDPDNLPDDLDLDADDGEDLVPAIGPAPQYNVNDTLRAQNRALQRLLKRQNLVIKVYGKKFDDQAARLTELEKKQHDSDRDQRFYQKVGAGLGLVFVAVIGSLTSYFLGLWKHQ